MRINVYSQELTDEVREIQKESNTGEVYTAAQLILHSSDKLHHPPEDDDRSAVTFWLPKSLERRESMARAFEEIASIFRPTLEDLPINSRPKQTTFKVSDGSVWERVGEREVRWIEDYRGPGFRWRDENVGNKLQVWIVRTGWVDWDSPTGSHLAQEALRALVGPPPWEHGKSEPIPNKSEEAQNSVDSL